MFVIAVVADDDGWFGTESHVLGRTPTRRTVFKTHLVRPMREDFGDFSLSPVRAVVELDPYRLTDIERRPFFGPTVVICRLSLLRFGQCSVCYFTVFRHTLDIRCDTRPKDCLAGPAKNSVDSCMRCVQPIQNVRAIVSAEATIFS
jgi:hypothetical protein